MAENREMEGLVADMGRRLAKIDLSEGITALLASETFEVNVHEFPHLRPAAAQHLTELGYEGREYGENIEADQLVVHVFRQAVNIHFAKRVDLTKTPPDSTGLEKLLCDSLAKNITRRKIGMYLDIARLISDSRLECPIAFLKHNILKRDRRNASQTFVKKLFECQLQLKWDTPIGLPKQFSYYNFCIVEQKYWKSTNFLENSIRSAHVKVQLYRHCMSHTKNNDIEADLCPTVYVKTRGRRWKSLTKDLKHIDSDINVRHFNWISEPIREYILANAETIPTKAARLKDRLTKHTLYWAVIKDSNFKVSRKVNFNPIGETQVYVGKANNGIQNRWLSNSSSHCRTMERCLRCFRGMHTYDAEVVKDVLLVDAVLLLEKLKGSKNSALFLMKTFVNEETLKDAESKNIEGKKLSTQNLNIIPGNRQWSPKSMAYGMNVASGRRTPDVQA